MNRYSLAAGAAAIAVLLAACSSSSKNGGSSQPPTSAPPVATSSTPATAPASGGIVISGFAYSGTLTVKPGQQVTVTNQDSMAHTLTDKQTKAFDTGNIDGNGGTGTFTAPTKPGSYPFGCTYHPNMHGTLVVKG
jgi:plastocyanin